MAPRGAADTFVLGGYLVIAGTIRFAIEFLRVNVRVLGIFTVAHLASLLVVASGIALLTRVQRQPSVALHSAGRRGGRHV